jgi:hypothetical protein
VSSSFYVVMSLAYVGRGISFSPLSCVFTTCICSRTCLMSANSFLMLPLWFSASSNSFIAWSYTLSVTRSTSSSMIVYFVICLWDLAFLRGPHLCMIGCLGGPVFGGVFHDGVFVSLCPPFLVLPALGNYPSFLSAHPSLGWFPYLTRLSLPCLFLGHGVASCRCLG